MDIRESLSNLVEASGKSRNKIAEEAGISKVYLWQLLTQPGKTPSAVILDKIAGVMGVTVDDILHPETGAIDEPNERYIFACIRCGSRNSLSVVPHRLHNDKHKETMVGLVYTCQRCWKFVVNGTVAVTFHMPEENTTDDQPIRCG